MYYTAEGSTLPHSFVPSSLTMLVEGVCMVSPSKPPKHVGARMPTVVRAPNVIEQWPWKWQPTTCTYNGPNLVWQDVSHLSFTRPCRLPLDPCTAAALHVPQLARFVAVAITGHRTVCAVCTQHTCQPHEISTGQKAKAQVSETCHVVCQSSDCSRTYRPAIQGYPS